MKRKTLKILFSNILLNYFSLNYIFKLIRIIKYTHNVLFTHNYTVNSGIQLKDVCILFLLI